MVLFSNNNEHFDFNLILYKANELNYNLWECLHDTELFYKTDNRRIRNWITRMPELILKLDTSQWSL